MADCGRIKRKDKRVLEAWDEVGSGVIEVEISQEENS